MNTGNLRDHMTDPKQKTLTYGWEVNEMRFYSDNDCTDQLTL